MIDQTKAYGIVLYKKTKNNIYILLCKSVNSNTKWGFLKGCAKQSDLTPKQTAQREFREESGILIDQRNFEKAFYQNNEEKLIGLYLVDGTNMPFLNNYFDFEGKLHKKYLSHENSHVKYFSIHNLPPLKKKQKQVAKEIIEYLNTKII
jgi:8-oxo-dGTP pyrophosphatase MutT (NUDIX family)